MAWASRWSVALRAFYKQILSSSNCKDFFFKWHRPPRKLAKEVFVKFIPAKEKTRFAKEWRKVLAKDHVIRIDSHEVFNTAHMSIHFIVFGGGWGTCKTKLDSWFKKFETAHHLPPASDEVRNLPRGCTLFGVQILVTLSKGKADEGGFSLVKSRYFVGVGLFFGGALKNMTSHGK